MRLCIKIESLSKCLNQSVIFFFLNRNEIWTKNSDLQICSSKPQTNITKNGLFLFSEALIVISIKCEENNEFTLGILAPRQTLMWSSSEAFELSSASSNSGSLLIFHHETEERTGKHKIYFTANLQFRRIFMFVFQ